MRRAIVSVMVVMGLSGTAAHAELGVDGDGNALRVDASVTNGGNRVDTYNGARGKRPRISRGADGDAAPEPQADYLGVGQCAGSDAYFLGAYTRAGLLVNSTGCPARPPSPVEAAYLVWHWETYLPAPAIATSPPDGAVTGLDLFLSVSGPMRRTIDLAALGYEVHLDITSAYFVDWGDGTVTGPHTTQGGPWPDGDLRHQYIHRGEVAISVTQRWTARWSAGSQSGVLADRLHTESSRTIPVDEIQAIVTG